MAVGIADQIYDILADHAGATGWDREMFRYWFNEDSGNEYRFQGSLGFGGKFRKSRNGW